MKGENKMSFHKIYDNYEETDIRIRKVIPLSKTHSQFAKYLYFEDRGEKKEITLARFKNALANSGSYSRIHILEDIFCLDFCKIHRIYYDSFYKSHIRSEDYWDIDPREYQLIKDRFGLSPHEIIGFIIKNKRFPNENDELCAGRDWYDELSKEIGVSVDAICNCAYKNSWRLPQLKSYYSGKLTSHRTKHRYTPGKGRFFAPR